MNPYLHLSSLENFWVFNDIVKANLVSFIFFRPLVSVRSFKPKNDTLFEIVMIM